MFQMSRNAGNTISRPVYRNDNDSCSLVEQLETVTARKERKKRDGIEDGTKESKCDGIEESSPPLSSLTPSPFPLTRRPQFLLSVSFRLSLSITLPHFPSIQHYSPSR